MDIIKYIKNLEIVVCDDVKIKCDRTGEEGNFFLTDKNDKCQEMISYSSFCKDIEEFIKSKEEERKKVLKELFSNILIVNASFCHNSLNDEERMQILHESCCLIDELLKKN